MGLLHVASENVKNLFRPETIEVIDEKGNTVVQKVGIRPIENPITLCRKLTWKNWLFFFVGWAAWTVDGFDFHSVSLSVTALSKYYGVSKTEVTTSITLTLLFRSVGAVIFGVAGDFYGRKYPMSINMIIIGAMQIATAYASTYKAFLAVRAVFGIGMGGIWGCAIAMALESCPIEARGLMSGILQQGYAVGYLLAAVFNLSLAPKYGFQILFYIGAGASFFIGLIRLLFPDSEQFEKAKAEGKRGDHTKNFTQDLKKMLRQEWKMMVYAIILMSWFNFFSHTTQDSYPTFLQSGKGMDTRGASLGTIIAKVGAVIGGTFIGHISQSIGRRRAIVISAVLAAALIPSWILPNTPAGLAAGSFFLQFMVQGAWGVIPGHLNEISPPAFRASFPGVAYQIGNMISSPSAEIVTAISENTLIWSPTLGRQVEAFGPTMGIATAIIAIGLAVWTAVGSERLGTHFEYAVAGVGDVYHETPANLEEGKEAAHQADSVDEKQEIAQDEHKRESSSEPSTAPAPAQTTS